jgi:hypothetical protein
MRARHKSGYRHPIARGMAENLWFSDPGSRSRGPMARPEATPCCAPDKRALPRASTQCVPDDEGLCTTPPPVGPGPRTRGVRVSKAPAAPDSPGRVAAGLRLEPTYGRCRRARPRAGASTPATPANALAAGAARPDDAKVTAPRAAWPTGPGSLQPARRPVSPYDRRPRTTQARRRTARSSGRELSGYLKPRPPTRGYGPRVTLPCRLPCLRSRDARRLPHRPRRRRWIGLSGARSRATSGSDP